MSELTKTHFVFLLSYLLLSYPVQAQAPVESYLVDQDTLKPALSEIRLPVQLSLATLSQIINKEMEGLLFQADKLKGNGGSQFDIKVWKLDSIRLQGKDSSLYSLVPLRIGVKGIFQTRVMGMSLSKDIDQDLKLLLRLKTNIELDTNWKVRSHSHLDAYEWVEEPAVAIGPIRISLRGILDNVITDQEKTLTEYIDVEIRRRMRIHDAIVEIWKGFQDPLAISEWEKDKIWLQFHPQDLHLSPLRFQSDTLFTLLSVPSLGKASVSMEEPSVEIEPLPQASFDADIRTQPVKLLIHTQLKRELLNQKARQMLVGKNFSFRKGKYNIQVKDVHLYGSGGNMVVDLDTEGSIEGKLYLIAQPHYHREKQKVELLNADYVIVGKTKLSRFTRWLFGGKIRKQIKKTAEEEINKRLLAFKQELREKLLNYPIDKNTSLTGNVNRLFFEDFHLQKEFFRTIIVYEGNLALNVTGL